MIEITVEVEDGEVTREAFAYLFKKLPLNSFVTICREVFEHGDRYLRDYISLAILQIDHPSLIPFMEWAVFGEKNQSLKYDLEKILETLKD